MSVCRNVKPAGLQVCHCRPAAMMLSVHQQMDAELALERRRRRKGLSTERFPLLRPEAPNLTWPMDFFVMDALACGRRIKCLTCGDDFTKERLTITAAFGISGVQVTRILDSITLLRGYPATIRTDLGPEFICRPLDQWAFEHGVELRLIQPGEPT